MTIFNSYVSLPEGIYIYINIMIFTSYNNIFKVCICIFLCIYIYIYIMIHRENGYNRRHTFFWWNRPKYSNFVYRKMLISFRFFHCVLPFSDKPKF